VRTLAQAFLDARTAEAFFIGAHRVLETAMLFGVAEIFEPSVFG
jgi:hypothetical protein